MQGLCDLGGLPLIVVFILVWHISCVLLFFSMYTTVHYCDFTYYVYSGTPLNNRTPLLSVIKRCSQLRGSCAHVRNCARKYLVAYSRRRLRWQVSLYLAKIWLRWKSNHSWEAPHVLNTTARTNVTREDQELEFDTCRAWLLVVATV